MPLGSVHGVLHSTAFVVARDLVVLVAVVVWLAQAHWVSRDARRRLDDSWLVVTATLLALVPFVGVFLYLLFRPAETLADVQVRELELRALGAALAPRQPEGPVCRLVGRSEERRGRK